MLVSLSCLELVKLMALSAKPIAVFGLTPHVTEARDSFLRYKHRFHNWTMVPQSDRAILEFHSTVGSRTGSVRPRCRLLVVSFVWMRSGDRKTADMSPFDQSVHESVRRANWPRATSKQPIHTHTYRQYGLAARRRFFNSRDERKHCI